MSESEGAAARPRWGQRRWTCCTSAHPRRDSYRTCTSVSKNDARHSQHNHAEAHTRSVGAICTGKVKLQSMMCHTNPIVQFSLVKQQRSFMVMQQPEFYTSELFCLADKPHFSHSGVCAVMATVQSLICVNVFKSEDQEMWANSC